MNNMGLGMNRPMTTMPMAAQNVASMPAAGMQATQATA